MKCDACGSARLFEVGGKSSDCNNWTYNGRSGRGYLPQVENICGGDYYEFTACLECGKIQGKFPVVSEELERDPEAEAMQCFFDNWGSHPGKFFSLGIVDPSTLPDDRGVRFAQTPTALWRSARRDVYGFLIKDFETLERTYVFVDDQMYHTSVRHFRDPHPDYADMTEITP